MTIAAACTAIERRTGGAGGAEAESISPASICSAGRDTLRCCLLCLSRGMQPRAALDAATFRPIFPYNDTEAMTPLAILHMWSDVQTKRSCRILVYGNA